MNCCGPAAELALSMGGFSGDETLLASKDIGEGLRQTELSIPTAHCAACIRTIESAVLNIAGVTQARLNLSTRRLTVKWRGVCAPPLLETLSAAGYEATLFDNDETASDPQLSSLIRAMAFSGFGAMNIMLLSVSVWSGAEAETRQAFHWISAALALPVILYSGRIFYLSAWNALRNGRTNMDVPITIGVVLAYALSLYDTIHHGDHAYFDASISLIFFLLIGRTLDYIMRTRARTAVLGLGRMLPRGATVIRDDGEREYAPVADIQPGMRLAINPGDRLVVDAVVESGIGQVDRSIATGESKPQTVEAGARLQAGALNLTSALIVRATSDAKTSFLAEMIQMMQAAEGGRANYRRIADRASQFYSPVVHLTALATLIGWVFISSDWHQAVSVAIAVLIITCPCALGLAVPMVQTVAARRLFEAGVMIKDGSGIERLAQIDSVAFDKTGILTLGRPRLASIVETHPGALVFAASMALHSNHSASIAIRGVARADAALFSRIREEPGLGIEGQFDSAIWRLGRGQWACGQTTDDTVLSRDGERMASFRFADALHPDAKGAVKAVQALGLRTSILSGDNEPAVRDTAEQVGISKFAGQLLPQDKIDRLAGNRTLMVGDGLNDAPALSAAHVSMAPASAADIGRTAADFVFLHNSLMAVPQAISLCRAADRLVRQNFALAIVYNAIALPVAILGFVTPLIAALAMSLSSVLVIANALRLGPSKKEKPQPSLNRSRLVNR